MILHSERLKFITTLFYVILFQYAIFLALLLLMEMAAGVLGFVFKDWVSFIKNLLIFSR